MAIFLTLIALDVEIASLNAPLIASSSTPICLARQSLLLIVFFVTVVLTTSTIRGFHDLYFENFVSRVPFIRLSMPSSEALDRVAPPSFSYVVRVP